MSKVRCSMVISPNGFISKPNGNEDWISEINWDDFVVDCERNNNFVVGRTTYEVVPELDDIKAEHKVVVSNQKDLKLRDGYILVNSPEEALNYLEPQNLPEVLLIGGGGINKSFAEAGLIDELELIIEPYVIGEGKRVLSSGSFEFGLELIKVENLSHGRIKISYKIKK